MNALKIVSLVLATGSALAGLSIVYITMWRTSPAGVEVQRMEHAETMKKLETRQLKYQHRHSQPAVKPPEHKVSTTQLPGKACIDLDMSPSTRRNPFVTEPGTCLVRNDARSNVWIQFKAEPREIVGSIGFAHLVPKEGPDGKIYPHTAGLCLTKDSPDQCAAFLREKLDIPLAVTNSGSVKIAM